MKFKQLGIDDNIQKALEKLNFQQVMPVQEKVIPLIQNKKDIFVKSKTGSGKTAAYAIPVIQDILWEENKPQCLILVPTRELALQVRDECTAIGTYKRIKTLAIFGKQPMKNQISDLKQKTHIVTGTPGRLLDHLKRETLDVSHITTCIIDEADEMLNMGFIEQVEEILSYLPEHITCMFSATMPKEIQELANLHLKNPEYIEMQSGSDVNEQIEHYAYEIAEHEKNQFLIKLLAAENPSSCIIFCKTQEHVNEVCEDLYELGLSVDKLHGGMMQQDRLDNINDFKRGILRFLVATDVAARGIDIEKVSHVINYDFPLEKESYVHRIGRTARKDASGKAISFISQFDKERKNNVEEFIGYKIEIRDRFIIDSTKAERKSLERLKKIGELKEDKDKEIQKELTKLYINGGKKKKLRAGDIVGAICEIDGVEGTDIGPIQIQDNVSYVTILNGKGNIVLNALRNTTIKGKKLRIDIAKE